MLLTLQANMFGGGQPMFFLSWKTINLQLNYTHHDKGFARFKSNIGGKITNKEHSSWEVISSIYDGVNEDNRS